MDTKTGSLDRRSFFRTAGRVAIGGALAALTTVLVRRGKGKPEFLSCDRRFACRGCPRLDECPEPAAHGQREAG